MPKRRTIVTPPKYDPTKQRARWNGTDWDVEDLPSFTAKEREKLQLRDELGVPLFVLDLDGKVVARQQTAINADKRAAKKGIAEAEKMQTFEDILLLMMKEFVGVTVDASAKAKAKVFIKEYLTKVKTIDHDTDLSKHLPARPDFGDLSSGL